MDPTIAEQCGVARELRRGRVRRAQRDGGRPLPGRRRQLVARGAQLRQPDEMTASGSTCWSASARVAASGVEPTTWNIATDPDEAAAAPSALRRSSDWPGGQAVDRGHRRAGVPADNEPEDGEQDVGVAQRVGDVGVRVAGPGWRGGHRCGGGRRTERAR